MSRIAIVHDAAAADGRLDASDTLLEAEAIARALRVLGFEPSILPAGLDLGHFERDLAALAPDVVFNLVESLAGRGPLLHVVPALLETLGVPVTGCSSNALALTSHKLLAKRQLLRAGLPAPALFEGSAGGEEWIVKSVWEHSSLGLDDGSIVRGDAVATQIAARCAEYGGDWFAERYVPGRELNIAVIAAEHGPRVLPVAEIRFDAFPADKPQIVGYAAKWHTDSFEYRNTPRAFGVEAELAARAERLALECWELFGLDGYARVDLRIDAAGAPWVLEINANPCLSPDAGFAAALTEGRVDYDAAIGWLVADALRRRPSRRRSS